MKYFLYINNQSIGPMTAEQVTAYPVNEKTLVCTTTDHEWRPLLLFPELMSAIKSNRTNQYPNTQYLSEDSQKTTAGVLALLLGWLGIQYFYLDKPLAGVLTILLTAVTCGIWGILMAVQGILMLTMSVQEFQQKYVNTTSSYPLF